jgi:hypothetical protein
VGVEVDEAGCDDAVGGIDDASRPRIERRARDEDDPIAGDREVGPEPLGARAVDDSAIPDQEVVGLGAGQRGLGRGAAAESGDGE